MLLKTNVKSFCKMGSSASSQKNKDTNSEQAAKQLLLQRKVTTDILERLARVLPVVNNPLAKTLKLQKESQQELEWGGNLMYLEEWKKVKKDDATIGNLIELLKSGGHKPDVYECLFNISREPKNATTATDKVNTSPRNSPTPPRRTHTANQPLPPARPISKPVRTASRTNPRSPRKSIESPPEFASNIPVDTILLPHDHKPIVEEITSLSGCNIQPKTEQYDTMEDNYYETDAKIQDTGYRNLHSSHDPQFKTEAKRNISRSPTDDLKQQMRYEALHPWTDYREWGDVATSWTFGTEDGHHGNSQSAIGEYMPGIAVVNQVVRACKRIIKKIIYQNIVATDTKEKMLHFFTTTGQLVNSVSTGNLTPGGICFTNHDTIAVSCGTVVGLWSPEGEYMGEFGRGMFGWCRGICMDHTNRFIISDMESNTVTLHSIDGHLITTLQAVGPNQFNKPYYVTVNHRNQILVCDSRNHCIKVFDKNGHYLSKFGSFGSSNGQLRVPLGIHTDCCGNVLVCDYGNHRISMFSCGGWFLKNFLTRAQSIGQPIAVSSFGKRKLVVSTMGRNYLNAFEFSRSGERNSPLIDYMQ